MIKKAQDWQKERELSNRFWLNLIIKIALFMPRWSVRLLLHPIVAFYVVLAAKKRKISYHYLSQSLQTSPNILHAYKHFYWFAAVLLDRVYFLTGKTEIFDIRFSRRQEVIDSFKACPGQFFISAHFGGLEALKTQSMSRDYEIRPVMKIDHNQTIVSLLKELNPDFYKSVIPYKGLETAFTIQQTLENGISIALLADRPIDSNKIIPVKFFEGELFLPAGLFQMILKFKRPVNVFFNRYEGGNRYDVEYYPISVEADETVESLAHKYVALLEKQCRQSPYNWFNFYPYWLSPNEKE